MKKLFYFFVIIAFAFSNSISNSQQKKTVASEIDYLKDNITTIRYENADLKSRMLKLETELANLTKAFNDLISTMKNGNSQLTNSNEVFVIKFRVGEINSYNEMKKVVDQNNYKVITVDYSDYTFNNLGNSPGYIGEIGIFSSYKTAYDFISYLPRGITYKVIDKAQGRE